MIVKPYFWMNLSAWMGSKIIIKCGGKKMVGYLSTARNQMGFFYLYDSKDKNNSVLLFTGQTRKVEYVSIFWGLIFHKSIRGRKKINNFWSDLPVSCCIPIDGNIPCLQVPFGYTTTDPTVAGYKIAKQNGKHKIK